MANAIDPRWAWAPYGPSAKDPWDLKKVGHLHRRAAFGATAEELENGLKAGPEKAVAQLLQGAPGQEEFDRKTQPLREAIARSNDGNGARAWWLFRMIYGPHPAREKLTLFWHNHFATSDTKVQNVALMLRQYDLMRSHAQGNFRAMLQEMSKDPAMMVWLDTRDSKKGSPNENYARELMELFSLGIGHYTEKDIREAARAFTGWEIRNGEPYFNPAQHDDGEKTVLGKTGKYQGSDVVKICLDQPVAAEFIVQKLFRFLVSETVMPTPELLAPLAEQFRKSDYDFGALVSVVLRSNLFFSASTYRTRVKSPVDFALGIIRPFRVLEADDAAHRLGRVGTQALGARLAELGQSVFHPPSVKGWDGGPVWLNGQTLLFRQNLALDLTSTENQQFGRGLDPARLAKHYGAANDGEVVGLFLKLFLQGDVPADSRSTLLSYLARARKQAMPVYYTEEDRANHPVRALCHLVLTLPEYQLD